MRRDPHGYLSRRGCSHWKQGGEAGVNRHEDFNRKGLQDTDLMSGRRTDDSIELYLDCLSPLLSEFKETVRSIDG